MSMGWTNNIASKQTPRRRRMSSESPFTSGNTGSEMQSLSASSPNDRSGNENSRHRRLTARSNESGGMNHEEIRFGDQDENEKDKL